MPSLKENNSNTVISTSELENHEKHYLAKWIPSIALILLEKYVKRGKHFQLLSDLESI